MPRLNHTFEITPVEPEVVSRIVDAAHEVARACRFDGRGWLLTPDDATQDGLERRADELGLIDRRAAERRRREQREAAETLREEGAPPPGKAEESAVEASSLALQLNSGRHLAPRSHYRVAELSAAGVPREPDYDKQGWSSTGLTVTAWDERGTSSVEFAMPDTVGTEEKVPVTWGTATHDSAAGLVTTTFSVRLPGRGARFRSAHGTLRIDTRAWYAALDGEDTASPPVLLEAFHTLGRIRAWFAPAEGPDGRWRVAGVLDARGRGPARPFAAMAFWAIRASVRREDRRARKHPGPELTTMRDRTAHAQESWDRVARNAPGIPAFLRDVARAMEAARPGSGPETGPGTGA